MTDETSTRARRRVRVRGRGAQADGGERTRQRSGGADGDGGAASPSRSTSVRRVRRRSVDTRNDASDDGGSVSSANDTGARTAGHEDARGDATDSGGTSRGTSASKDSDNAAKDGGGNQGRRRGRRSGNADGDTRRGKGGGRARGTGRDGVPDDDGRAGAASGGGGVDDASDGDSGRASAVDGDGGREDASDSNGSAGAARDDNGGSDRSRRQRGRKGRRRPSGSSPRRGVSEEVRRSITEGPPRRMLVSVGRERTEVAVLEERDLVEHYVTRKANESYVGNIYLGRVQNVLPGMEAAFVDIGKGRNGVLYAGEVNYDDEDVESKAPRIEQALKPGQTVVVQVTKDPMGTKGARLTQQLSLAGRFCVLAIEDGTVGISRKLTDSERDRLRETLREIKPEGYGLIVRTAAAGATDEQLEADVKRLLERWGTVQQRLTDAKPLTEVYREPELAMRVIRDVYGPEFVELICDDADLAEQISDYLSDVSPELAPTLQRYTGDEPLFTAYEVTNQVRRALEKKVWLPSGGYLIIEKTEAMWVIDVNTGKFVGDSNLEETVLKNNLEAAEEITRQLRLRDMGGIIVIDFVDMIVPANRDEVLKRFKRELARDKTKSRVMEISKLGLVQMTRKNVSQGLTETFTKTCDCCEGRGAQIVDKALKR
ncbi:MAG TPA: Rne/Rng family ribonuclease [Euzebyales bacterium]